MEVLLSLLPVCFLLMSELRDAELYMDQHIQSVQ